MIKNYQQITERINKEPKESEIKNFPGVFTGKELLHWNIETLPTLLDPVFPAVGLIGLIGSSDTGKSSFLRNFVVNVVTGASEFIGFPLNTIHRKAIYVTTEDDETLFANRLLMINQSKQLDIDDYGGLIVVVDTSNLIAKLDQIISEEKVDVIIIDAITDLYQDHMNESNRIRYFLNQFMQLAVKHKCLVVVLHHTGKRTDNNHPSKHNALGSQGFEAKLRLVVEFRKDKRANDLRHFCLVKGNYLPEEFKNSSYVLRISENLTFDATGERVPFDNLQSKEMSGTEKEVIKRLKEGQNQMKIASDLELSQSRVSRIKSKNNIQYSHQ